jgi:hypothetical protein
MMTQPIFTEVIIIPRVFEFDLEPNELPGLQRVDESDRQNAHDSAEERAPESFVREVRAQLLKADDGILRRKRMGV